MPCACLGHLDPRTPPPFFAANAADRRLSPSERVVFIDVGGDAAAVPFSALAGRRRRTVVLAGRMLSIRVEGTTAVVRDERGRIVPFSEPFWFAVAAFHPDVRVVR